MRRQQRLDPDQQIRIVSASRFQVSFAGRRILDLAPADRVKGLMPQLRADLARLVAIPSVSVTSYPSETHAALHAARDARTRRVEPVAPVPGGDRLN